MAQVSQVKHEAKKKGIRRVPPAVDEMRALDGALWWSLGFGLEMYMATGQMVQGSLWSRIKDNADLSLRPQAMRRR